MKVALVDLNFMTLNGESTYLLHMQAGLKDLGISADIISCTASGRKPKYAQHGQVIWVKDAKLVEYLSTYDVLHFNNGRLDEKEYVFLNGIADLGKICTIITHGVTQRKDYQVDKLVSVIKPKAFFNVDSQGIEDYRDLNIPLHLIELPFSREIMPRGDRIPIQNRIVVPARFSFIKYPGEVLELFKKLSHRGFVVDFYGYSGFVANAQGKLSEFEALAKDGAVRLNPPFYQEDKFNVYNGAMYMFDGTRIKRMAPGRIQYTSLEAMFYGIVPVIHRQWFHDHICAIAFDNVEEVMRLAEKSHEETRILLRCKNYELLTHYDAAIVCQKFKDVWECL